MNSSDPRLGTGNESVVRSARRMSRTHSIPHVQHTGRAVAPDLHFNGGLPYSSGLCPVEHCYEGGRGGCVSDPHFLRLFLLRGGSETYDTQGGELA